MASSGKKGKKSKGNTVSLQDFLADSAGAAPVRKYNWSDEVDNEDVDYSRRDKVVLPTAPRANRPDVDDDKIPQNPPYLSYLSNLPYEVNEDEIAEFFKDLDVVNVRLPRDDRQSGKLKGFGYVEFGTRESLISALNIPDKNIKQRHIRIEVADNSQDDRRRGGMRGSDRDRDRDGPDRTTTDWRSGPRDELAPDPDRERDRGGFRDKDSRDRGGPREGLDRDWRSGGREEPPSDRDGDRGGFRDREGRDRGTGREAPDRDWRSGGREEPPSDRVGSTAEVVGAEILAAVVFVMVTEGGDLGMTVEVSEMEIERASVDLVVTETGMVVLVAAAEVTMEAEAVGDLAHAEETMTEKPEVDSTEEEMMDLHLIKLANAPVVLSQTTEVRGDRGSNLGEVKSRPRLNLHPRTKPVEKVDKIEPAQTKASIFGGAKPVDTAAKQREIEERLAAKEKEIDVSWPSTRESGRTDDSRREDRSIRPLIIQSRSSALPGQAHERSKSGSDYGDRDEDASEPKKLEPAPLPKGNAWNKPQGPRKELADGNGQVSPAGSDPEHGRGRHESPPPTNRYQASRDESPKRHQPSRGESPRKYQAPRGESPKRYARDQGDARGAPPPRRNQYERDDRGGGQSRERGGHPSRGGDRPRGRGEGRPLSERDSERRREPPDDIARMPKVQEQETTNFVGSNKFDYLPADEDEQ
uniref:RRM domain-containing protein n=1 Tax=Timema genevievae TaxID=629358 RepID=A0A7R9PH53_TIMGE|nr:unnamed protein product [Timema genevievae]